MEFADLVRAPHVAAPLRLLPFRAVMLSGHRVGDPASVRVFSRPYRAVAERLDTWEQQGHVRRDNSPALYLHEFTSNGVSVRGFVGAMDITHLRHDVADCTQVAVSPHEAIHSGQAEDLARRMLAMGVDPAPILLVHRGSAELKAAATSTTVEPPTWSYDDKAGQRHRVWAIRDANRIQQIRQGLAGIHTFIADGHHRYVAHAQLQRAHPGTPWDRALAVVIDQSDTPLVLGPIHRLVRGTTLPHLATWATDQGATVTAIDRQLALGSLDPSGMVFTTGDAWLHVVAPLADESCVEWLHHHILDQQQGLSIEFSHHADQAVEVANAGCVAILLPAMTMDRVATLVDDGQILPEKATSFQPKPSIGSLMRLVSDEAPSA